MITIDKLLESVDLDFEPRFVTKDKNGWISFFDCKPVKFIDKWLHTKPTDRAVDIFPTKLAEFAGKDWTECIYEVPRKDKPVVKIEKLNLLNDSALLWGKKINELVAAVNELKGAK